MAPKARPVVRQLQAAFIATVLAALCLPLAQWSKDVVRLGAEKRRAGVWPGTPRTRAEVRAWPAAVEAFVRDRIGLRDAAVRTYNRLVFFALRTSPVASVVRGRDGWLFYDSAAEQGPNTMADARRSRPLSRRKLYALADMILARRDLVSGWGGRYLFVVVPNKSSVYPERLPAALTQVGLGKPLEQLSAALAPPGTFVDLTPALLAAKSRTEVYWRTDSHWNEMGALAGLTTIMTVLRRDFPGLRVPDQDDLIGHSYGSGGRDLAGMLNLAHALSDRGCRLAPKAGLKLPDFQRKLKVWVYADSFYGVLPDVWSTYLPGIEGEPVYRPWVEEQLRAAKPDVVIELVVERRLRYQGRDPSAWL